jgi:thiosulfate dehydrogenase
MRNLLIVFAAAALGGCSSSTSTSGEPATGKEGTTEVKLCDNHTTVDVPSDMAKTRENGQAVSDALMAQWKQKNPGVDWEADIRRSHPRIPPPDDNSAILVGAQHEGQTYGRFSQQDVQTWNRELEKLVLDGAAVFHDADRLGSTIAVSCDMCHPDASNTHPETYPKFQPQLGRVALLRDMINWCIEHPVRGVKLAPDDPKMRALEAYIMAQRKGAAMNYGAR